MTSSIISAKFIIITIKDPLFRTSPDPGAICKTKAAPGHRKIGQRSALRFGFAHDAIVISAPRATSVIDWLLLSLPFYFLAGQLRFPDCRCS